MCPLLPFLPVFPGVIGKPVLPLRVITVMVWEVDPLWRVGGCAVHKALHRPASSWRLLEGAVRAFPLDDHNPHRGALVHIRAALELIEEAQHPLIHSVDLPSHTAALPWEVQQTWNVVFSSNHQGVRLHRVALALEGRAAIGVVQQNLVVGLASLQGPIHEHVGHAAGHAAAHSKVQVTAGRSN